LAHRTFCSARRTLVAAAMAISVVGQTPATAQGVLAPVVFFLDVTSGPVRGGPGNQGVPIGIFGRGFGAAQDGSTVTINGAPAAAVLSWGVAPFNPHLEMIVVQPGAIASAGPVVVTVGGRVSNATEVFTPTTGNVYGVAPGGNDNNLCSMTQPCATILHAATNVLRAGDALLVRGGPVADDEIWIREDYGHSGAPGRDKTIRNYPGETPVFTKTGRPVILDANYITWSGFDFPGGKSIVVGQEQHRANRVVNNRFTGAISYDAIGTHGDGHVLAGNVCDVAPSTVGTQGHCYYISHGRGVQLRYNTARGASGYGIHIFDQKRADPDITRVIADVLVEGNVLSAARERSGLIVAMGDEAARGNHINGVTIRNNVFVGSNFAGIAIGGLVRNVRIEHNTFYQNGRQGITIYDDATINNVLITNNLIDQSTNANCVSNCSWYPIAHIQRGAAARAVTVTHNVYAPGPVGLLNVTDVAGRIGPAGLVSPASGNFRLTAGSAANDAGRSGETKTDFDGQPRSSSAPDVGAFEFVTFGPAPPTATLLPNQRPGVYLPLLKR
jgi:hypothetical protein